MNMNRIVCILSVLISAQAFALPFNQDMVDHQLITGKVMRPLPENSIPIGSVDRQIKDAEQIKDWKNPYQGNQTSIDKGQRNFAVSCAPCHGTFKDGNHVPAVIQLKGMPSINLADQTIGAKPDAHFFNYIYNGGVLMPPYGYKLSNDEIWHIISYVRSVQGRTGGQASSTVGGK